MKKTFLVLYSAGLALATAGFLAGCESTTTTSTSAGGTNTTTTVKTLDTNAVLAVEGAANIILSNLPADAAAAVSVAQAVATIQSTVHGSNK